jgi:hypothetical protein
MSLANSGPEQREIVRYATEHGLSYDQAFFEMNREKAKSDLSRYSKDKKLKRTIRGFLTALDNAEADAKERERIRIATGGHTGG